jgi:hypothetical protein
MAMTKDQKVAACGVIALLGYMWFMSQSEMPNVNVDPRSIPDNQYDPFKTWRHDNAQEWFRPFPATVGPNVLPLIVQNADSGLALTAEEIYGASSAQ